MNGPKSVLVTGATGFVGRALVPRLLAEGRNVRAAARPSSGALPAEVERALVDDIGPDTDWRGALAGVDAIVHLAARAHVLGESSADAHALLPCREHARRAAARRSRGSGRCAALRVPELGAGCTASVRPGRPSASRARSWRRIRTADPRRTPSAASRRSPRAGALEPVDPPPAARLRPRCERQLRAARRGSSRAACRCRSVRCVNRRSLVFVGNLVDAIVLLARPSAPRRARPSW